MKQRLFKLLSIAVIITMIFTMIQPARWRAEAVYNAIQQRAGSPVTQGEEPPPPEPPDCSDPNNFFYKECGLAEPAGLEQQAMVSVSGSPISFNVYDATQVAVYHNGIKQFYNDYHEGVYIWVNNIAYGPYPATNAYTTISNVKTGSGLPNDPWVVTTRVNVGSTGLQLEQSVKYINGNAFLIFNWRVTNTTGNSIAYYLFHAADLYTQDDDKGYGYYNSQTGGIGGWTSTHTFYQYFQPITQAQHFFEGYYGDVWNRIITTTGANAGFNDTYRGTDYIDNGAGLQWQRYAPPYGNDQVTDYLVFNTESALGPLVSPASLDFAATIKDLPLTIRPKRTTDAWSLSENISWLSLSQISGVGTTDVLVTVNRAGLSATNYSGTIQATVGGTAVSIPVSMRVAIPHVALLSPTVGMTFYQGGTMLIQASITLDGQPALNMTAWALLDLKGGAGQKTYLYDDGQHEDGAALDGLYGARAALYGALQMPTTGNPYTLWVYGDSGGAVGSTNTLIYASQNSGAPTVSLNITSPTWPEVLTNQPVTFTVSLTYPNSAVYNNTVVRLSVRRPNGMIDWYTLPNVGSNTFQVAVTFPVNQGGVYYMDIHVMPPDGVGYVDAATQARLEAYQGTLSMNLPNPPGTYYSNQYVPLNVCVTGSSGGVTTYPEDALVKGQITPEGTQIDLGHNANGCYTFNYYPLVAGAHNLLLTAEKTGWKSTSQTVTFNVNSGASNFNAAIQQFAENQILTSQKGMRTAAGIADTGDFFTYKIKADQIHLFVSTVLSMISVVTAGADASKVAKAVGNTKFWSAVRVPGVQSALANDFVDDAGYQLIESATNYPIQNTRVLESISQAPFYYYANIGNFDNYDGSEVRGYIQGKYKVMLGQGQTMRAKMYEALLNTVNRVQQKIRNTSTQAQSGHPQFTQEQEKAYFFDFGARSKANDYLGSRDLEYESGELQETRRQREIEDAQWWNDWIKFAIGWTLKAAVMVVLAPFGLSVLGAVAVEGAIGIYNSITISKQIEEDQKFRDQALLLMNNAFGAQSMIAHNTVGGLLIVKQGTSPETPKAAIQSLDHVRVPQLIPWFTRSIYTDVSIQNTGTTTADFAVSAFYHVDKSGGGFDQIIQQMWDPTTGQEIQWVTLAPGSPARTVRIYYENEKMEGNGTPNRLGVTFALYSINSKGIYVNDVKQVQNWSTRTADSAPAPADAPGVELTLDMEMARDDPRTLRAQAANANITLNEAVPGGYVERFPIKASVSERLEAAGNTMVVSVENPFAMPLAIYVYQDQPASITLLNLNDAVLNNSRIAWYRTLQPHEIAYLTYDFIYRGSFSSTVTFPAVYMQYYDASNGAYYTLNTGTITFTPATPLSAKVTANMKIPPETTQTVKVNISNLDPSSAQSGSVRLQILTLNNTIYVTRTANFNLAAGAGGNYQLTYRAPAEGRYLLLVDLNYGSRVVPITTNTLTVATTPTTLYMPVIAKLAQTVPVQNNDYISTPKVITSTPYSITQNTTGATTSTDDPTFPCSSGQKYHTVWFRITPWANGTLNVNTNGSSYDTILAIWKGAPGSLTIVGCDDDAGDGSASLLSRAVTAGQTYYIEVASYGSTAGTLKLNITFP